MNKKQEAKRQNAERRGFEHWYSKSYFISLRDLKSQRTEHGYKDVFIDGAWAGWSGRAIFDESL